MTAASGLDSHEGKGHMQIVGEAVYEGLKIVYGQAESSVRQIQAVSQQVR